MIWHKFKQEVTSITNVNLLLGDFLPVSSLELQGHHLANLLLLYICSGPCKRAIKFNFTFSKKLIEQK
jgi:hypothetical protein